MKLYVDDIRIAPVGWVQAWDAREAIDFLRTNEVTELSLDHDLGDSGEDTGYDIMCWIEAQVIFDNMLVPDIKFHTANPVGRANMEASYKAILQRQAESKTDK